MIFSSFRAAFVLSLACFAAGAAQAEPKSAQPYCDAPWRAFPPANGVQPFRPLISFEPESRFLHGGRAPGDVTVDFVAQQHDIRVGARLVHGVPIWTTGPDAGTAGVLSDANGQLCRIRPQDFASDAFREAWGYAPGRIELDFGDHFKSRVTSRLDYASPSPARPEGAPFGGAPCQATNLHTHGLLVSPYKDEAKGLYGDYVLDLASPQATDQCGGASAHHVHMMSDALNYDIAIPPNRPDPAIPEQALQSGYHPSGLFWFHPHPHGYSAKQLSGGMSGLITVGDADDHPLAPGAAPVRANQRLMLIRDMQVETLDDGSASVFVAGADPTLCAPANNARDTTLWPDSECSGGPNRTWIFTINGVQKPEITPDLKPDEAEVWRIANGSPSASYRLAIVPLADVTAKLPVDQLHPTDFRILSKDGVAVAQESDAKEILLMPGSRVSIELDRAREGGAFALISRGVYTGGDNWPAVVLATLKWPAAPAAAESAAAAAAPAQAAAPVAAPKKFRLTSRGPKINRSLSRAGAAPGPLPAKACEPLAGNERVILFVKNPNFGDADGYRNTDLFGVVAGLRTPPTRDGEPSPADYAAYRFFHKDRSDQALADMGAIALDGVKSASEAKFKDGGAYNFTPAFAAFPEFGNICARRSQNVDDAETWVIENWTNEFHNFHIHQSRFGIGEASQLQNYAYFRFPCSDPATKDQCANTGQSLNADGLVASFYQDKASPSGHAALGDALHDSVPVPRGTDACTGSIGGKDCTPGRITVRIPFNRAEQVGTFVYHCHILEHEDHGMMGLVQVIDPGAPEKAHAAHRAHH